MCEWRWLFVPGFQELISRDRQTKAHVRLIEGVGGGHRGIVYRNSSGNVGYLGPSFPWLTVNFALRSTTALANADQKTQPSLQPLQVLRLVDLICHLWQQYVTDAIFPLASASVTVRRDMVVFNNQTISKIEGAANAFLQRMIDCKFIFSNFCSLGPIITHFDQQSSPGFLPSCLNKRGMTLPLGTTISPLRALILIPVLRAVRCWRKLVTAQESV